MKRFMKSSGGRVRRGCSVCPCEHHSYLVLLVKRIVAMIGDRPETKRPRVLPFTGPFHFICFRIDKVSGWFLGKPPAVCSRGTLRMMPGDPPDDRHGHYGDDEETVHNESP